MLVTSKEANKMLHELEMELNHLVSEEEQSKSFLAAVGEDIESCRPKYNYEESQSAIKAVENKIIKLKHAINKFNTEAVVDGFDKTIDEMLIYIPQLTQRSHKLNIMQSKLPKTREAMNMRSTIIDYRYVNYDINIVKQDYKATVDELHKAQIALDTVNVTKQFEILI